MSSCVTVLKAMKITNKYSYEENNRIFFFKLKVIYQTFKSVENGKKK